MTETASVKRPELIEFAQFVDGKTFELIQTAIEYGMADQRLDSKDAREPFLRAGIRLIVMAFQSAEIDEKSADLAIVMLARELRSLLSSVREALP